MNKLCKIIFIICATVISIFSINIFSFVQCGSLLGRAGTMYTTTHNIFRDRQSAIGAVRMANGFSVVTPASGVGSTHGSCVYMDTSISVSGAIDLRETNTIILLEDLKLDNGVTLSSGGNLYGYDRALILKGNLTIPNGKIIHTGGRIVIDGNGHKLSLGNSAQLFIDTDATLTLRNLVLQNTKNQPGHPAVQCATSGSKLCLDNVKLALVDDFYFNRGQFFVHNDVAVTGTSALVYRACQPSFITSGAKLFFDVGTTFSVAPATFTDCPYSRASTTTTNNFILMADQTSTIYLNGCSLYTTLTGCRLTKGSLIFDNHVSMRSNASNTLNSISSSPYSATISLPISGDWSPDGRFIAVSSNASTGPITIYSFNGSSNPTAVGSVNTDSGPQCAIWSPDGRFIAVANWTTSSLQVFSFNASISFNPVLVGSATVSGSMLAARWSPDGRFLAVTYSYSSYLHIFSFNGTGNPILVGTAATPVSNYIAQWSPDGKFIAVGSLSGGNLQVFSFKGASNPVLVATATNTSPGYAQWSPDGRFIAIGNTNTNTLQVYSFYGSSSLVLVGSSSAVTGIGGLEWSHDGRFIATVASSPRLQVYSFNGSGNPVAIGSATAGSGQNFVRWSPDDKFILIASYNTNTLQIFPLNYVVNRSAQGLANSIVFGNSALGSSYDLNVRGLADTNVNVEGLLNYDNVS